MSAFSNVDSAVDPSRLIASLDESARGLASMKHYMAAAHGRLERRGWILDVGCGAGHDMLVLAQHNIEEVIGLDPSTAMLDAARARTPRPLVRAVAEALPFRTGVFAGCWIERVLMHVTEPDAVVAEAVRCLRPDAVVTVFEPDWSSLTVNGARVPTAWTSTARHPSIGSEVGPLLRRHGCFVQDRVEERSWWTFEQFDVITKRALSLAAPTSGVGAQRWLQEVRASAERGEFQAEMTKIMWLATVQP